MSSVYFLTLKCVIYYKHFFVCLFVCFELHIKKLRLNDNNSVVKDTLESFMLYRVRTDAQVLSVNADNDHT